jgi:hypothetical protein
LTFETWRNPCFSTFETWRNPCFSTFEPISAPHALTLNTNLKNVFLTFELGRNRCFFWTFVSTQTKFLQDPRQKQIRIKWSLTLTQTNKQTIFFIWPSLQSREHKKISKYTE